MQDRPTAIELIEAVSYHLSQQVIPTLRDPRLRFRTLVAANVLTIVVRELQLAETQAVAEWRRLCVLLGEEKEGRPPAHQQLVREIEAMNALLCRQIEAGHFDDPAAWHQLLGHCRETAQEKLAIANPEYLARSESI